MTAINKAKECFYERATQKKRESLIYVNLEGIVLCSYQFCVIFHEHILREIPHGNENNKLHAWINYFFEELWRCQVTGFARDLANHLLKIY